GVAVDLMEFGGNYGFVLSLPCFPAGVGLGAGVFYNNGTTWTWGGGTLPFTVPGPPGVLAWQMQQACMAQQAWMMQIAWQTQQLMMMQMMQLAWQMQQASQNG